MGIIWGWSEPKLHTDQQPILEYKFLAAKRDYHSRVKHERNESPTINYILNRSYGNGRHLQHRIGKPCERFNDDIGVRNG